MGRSLPSEGNPFPSAAGAPGATLDRLASFRLTYVAIFCFLLLYVFSVKGLERVLTGVFQARVEAAIQLDPAGGDIPDRIRERVGAVARGSAWSRIGGIRVTPFVVAADGVTPLYLAGRPVPPLLPNDPRAEAERLLPATAEVAVTVPHNSLAANAILIVYAALLLQTLFLYERRRSRAELARLEEASRIREESAARAARIEAELADLGRQLDERVEAEVAVEIDALRSERRRLEEQLAALGGREAELRAEAGKLQETLQSERQSLEELLDDALADLARKDEEVRGLSERLQRAQGKGEAAAPRARDLELLGNRLRTLYRNLELDDHAIRNLIGLGDEAMRLRAEESIKRLDADLETAAVRRKVGGLPGHLTIFELGFAGKGRVYYTNGRQRRFRILAVGAKNSQKTDLEYLSRLPREA